jgi:uncharacterized protein with HEPN domain
MKSSMGDKQRLLHIRDAIREIESFVDNITEYEFYNNSLIKSACIFQLEIIGEAAAQITSELKENNKHIEWRNIIAVRNLIAHVYWGIDHKQVWQILQTNIPLLKEQINELIVLL